MDAKRYKAHFITKDFIRKNINYNETFYAILLKDSFKLIIALMTHFNLELYQKNMTFLNGEIDEIIYTVQLKKFVLRDSNNIICKLKKNHLWA